jgi:hypothetical protein
MPKTARIMSTGAMDAYQKLFFLRARKTSKFMIFHIE